MSSVLITASTDIMMSNKLDWSQLAEIKTEWLLTVSDSRSVMD